MKLVFWCTLALTFYTFVLYPVILLVLHLAKKPETKPAGIMPATYQPNVSFIIAAHNEEAVIEKKIFNTLDLRYPRDKIQIIVASDNSTDATNDIVKRYQNKGVLLLDLRRRGGKTRAQNEAVKMASGEILVFSDANSMWKPDALEQLMRHFTDNKTGYVCGQLKYVNTGSNSGYSEGLYWKYEMLLRRLESSLHSVTAGNGAIYAVRAADYVNIAELYSHDLEMPHLMVAKGKRAIYEPAAIAIEKTASNSQEEYRRKIRMLTRTWHRVIYGPCLYNPFKYGVKYAWMMVSHRLFRYLFPFFQIIIYLSNCCLWKQGLIYQGLLISETLFYLLALAGYLLPLKSKLFYLPYYFCMFNYASLAGFVKAATGKVSTTWDKAESTRAAD
ncbi:glycosyltransferase family 2 protein [Desulfallas sp. Bu1-1]|uniref:glycosyltransferase family 2 protein n=1 Tax=Desulfallas sp. Bu1-1 TaxID=2787620 RepID=UPI00189D90E2|nr:glycosyltransferase family 2 protein [Desulfallas sp. Bu1-1]MBF7081407.1 glycosyltransferase family 2 protein [Desulfallas sp. Bu1-1]